MDSTNSNKILNTTRKSPKVIIKKIEPYISTSTSDSEPSNALDADKMNDNTISGSKGSTASIKEINSDSILLKNVTIAESVQTDRVNSDLNFTIKEEKDNDKSVNTKSNFIYSKVSQDGKEKYIGLKITNLNDLKKSIPSLKLPSILSSSVVKKPSAVSREVKEKLQKYCRTCAGQKFPLIDIFGVKGKQMRLSQQLQHLENIEEDSNSSTQMCMDCVCDLKMSYKFFMQIKKAEMKLISVRTLLSESSNKSNLIKNESKNAEYTESSNITMHEKIKTKYESDTQQTNLQSDLDIQNNIEIQNTFQSDGSTADFDCYYSQDETKDYADVSVKSETSTSEIVETVNGDKYKYNESSSTYVKIAAEKIESCIDGKSDEGNDASHSVPLMKSTTQSGTKLKNLKRKLTVSMNDGSQDSSNKVSHQKLNVDLKDLKIPKLNLQNTENITKEENGVMYVTTKGSKPNEMLLIKVKKVDKPTEKKGDKGKKKLVMPTYRKIYRETDDMVDTKDYIDKQIEQYKKRRVQILGESANVDFDDNDDELDVRAVCNNADYVENTRDDENSQDTNYRGKKGGDLEIYSFSSQLLKPKSIWKSIKKTHDNLNKDLAEDYTNRLKNLLRQNETDIRDFLKYLKQRRIVVSRLSDDEIILMYEHKNNVVISRPPIEEIAILDTEDPFDEKETYECDFCDESFLEREKELEHSRIHDFKLMHCCEDCGAEFTTHKAKRNHIVSCTRKLICKYCKEKLVSRGKKRQHEQKHCDEQNGQLCDICGEKFKHLGTLDQHVKTRHLDVEKILQCPECPKKFAFKPKLSFHIKTVHTTSRAFLCEDCGSDFKNPASLRHHRIRKHQATNNKKECKVCQKMIPIYSMSKHMHTHKAYSIECPHCDKMFKNSSTLKQHLRIHEDQRQYKCDMCGVGFNRRDGLKLHLKVHQKSESRALKECSCQICGEKFPNHSTLVIHRNRTHKDGRKFTCHICNRSMISGRSLEYHLANIHNEILPGVKDASSVDVETKRVTCQYCKKTFKTEMILRTHVKNTHVEKEPLKCLDCEMTFKSEVRLKHHMMTTHNRIEGTITCPHCPKRFVNHLRLKTHMISHSDLRPHTCDECGFNLKTKIQLIKHKQNRHSSDRPLACRFCKWRCKQVSALVCHERTHTNERPYSCKVCGQKFKYLGDKNKHERRHPEVGGQGFKRIVTGRNTTKVAQKTNENSNELDSEQESTEQSQEQFEEFTEYEQQVEEGIEEFHKTQMDKFESEHMIVEDEDASFDHMYAEDSTQNVSDAGKTEMSIEETTVYTEEVTADHAESGETAGNIDQGQLLQAGTTLYQIAGQDENGKIQVIPLIFSLPDLSDGSEVGLTNSSISYKN